MDFAALGSIFESPSIVAWFALLVTVFAVFVGLGLYASRSEARQRAATLKASGGDEELRATRTRKSPGPHSRSAQPRRSTLRSHRELEHSQETP